MLNKALLDPKVQQFIRTNRNEDIPAIVLKGSPFEGVTVQELAIQIKGHSVAEKKFPEFFKKQGLIYPPKLNLEQTSSEITAKYKASLVQGTQSIDLTGGLGIDSFYLSKKFRNHTYCELNSGLADVAKHNFKVLQVENIEVKKDNGLNILKASNQRFDLIYADPARRDEFGGKVFALEDCEPNIPENLDLLLKRSGKLMLKTSPILDIHKGLQSLRNVKEIHIVAVRNEVKELLWILENEFDNSPDIITVNYEKDDIQTFSGNLDQIGSYELSVPLAYLYEPNSALMKSGLFGSLGETTGTFKLHEHSHLFTSKSLLDFPGRCFKVVDIMPFKSSYIKKTFKRKKANITTRNFPEQVESIRKKFKIKDGGDAYLFFTTDLNENKIVIQCEKVV